MSLTFKNHIRRENIPQHVAIIMDGNGRWAQKKGVKRLIGHQTAVRAVRETAEGCAEIGVSYLTLFAFSTENWKRPKTEVNGLMTLLLDTVKRELPTLLDNDIKLNTIGEIDSMPDETQKSLKEAIKLTNDNKGMVLNIAINYSGRWDIVNAVNAIIKDHLPKANTSTIKQYLSTSNIPDPELLIRTSGEMRLSNFLLWELAYSELYFTDIFWPEFRKKNLYEAIYAYQRRERRFGKTSEQINVKV